jgi:hypothetical protein
LIILVVHGVLRIARAGFEDSDTFALALLLVVFLIAFGSGAMSVM